MVLSARSGTDLISGPAMRSATRSSLLLCAADAVFPPSLDLTASAWSDESTLSGFCSTAGTDAAGVALFRELRRGSDLLLNCSRGGAGRRNFPRGQVRDLCERRVRFGSGIISGLHGSDRCVRHLARNCDGLPCDLDGDRRFQSFCSACRGVSGRRVRRTFCNLSGRGLPGRGRHLPGPGHVGLASAVTRQSFDIDDVR